MTKPKVKNRNYCSKCHSKHYPPTGKKCQNVMDKLKNQPSTSVDPVTLSSDSGSDGRDSGMGVFNVDMGKKKVTQQKDCVFKRVSNPGQARPSDHTDGSDISEDECPSGGLEALILKELQRVNSRLDVVEATVQGHRQHRRRDKDTQKLSKVNVLSKSESYSRKSKSSKHVSESSSDEETLPTLSTLRTSRQIQRQVDARIAEIESQSKVQVIIQKGVGGGVDVLVSKKVAWPHDNVLGGVTRQIITYDQLSLTQFIQGFTRNILNESDGKIRDQMLWYMSDLMEDATDFSWASAKAAHAVILCEMERGTVCWSDTSRIDRIRRAHAQKHKNFTKQNWIKKIRNSKSHGLANCIKLVSANFRKTTNLVESFKNISVPLA